MAVISSRFTRIARRLLRAPLFSTVAILTLAVGIGANAAIFSVVNGVLLKPLPFPDAERLAAVWHTALASCSAPSLRQLRPLCGVAAERRELRATAPRPG